MLTELCQEIKNYFETEKVFNTFTINSSVISPSVYLQTGQYFRIVGSVFNDGIHKKGDELIDETFKGSIWLLSIPKAVIDLSNEIDVFNSSNNATSYSSESFGGYSYSKNGNGTWQEIFSKKLNEWRKM